MILLRLLGTILALLGLAAVPLGASTVVGAGNPASCTEASLSAAIAEANGTSGLVTFDCGAAPHTIVVTSEKALGQGVAIDGGGKITLDGNGATRIFSIAQGVAVQIGNLTLSRGFANPGGGCILAFSSQGNESQLVLGNVTFSECRAAEFGGAIAGNFTNLAIEDSRLDANQADTGGGGAVSVNNSGLSVLRTHFGGNLAAIQGGAIQAWFSEVAITGSELEGNDTTSTLDAAAGGGAMVLQSSGATVRDTSFFLNTAGRHGAAVLLLSGADATFEDSRFGYNFASRSGGGVYVDSSSTARLERCTLWGNSAANYGGALFSRNVLEVRNTTFHYNLASLGGTAVFTEVGSLAMVSSTLVDNYNPGAPATTGQIAWSAGTTIAVHNTLIQSPREGALACAPSGPADFTSSIWNGTGCPAGAGSHPATVLPLYPFGFSCGGAATELTRTLPFKANALIDAGNCRPGDPTTDQRGMPRPNGAGCDVGATEFFEPCDAPFFIDGFETGSTARWSQTLGWSSK